MRRAIALRKFLAAIVSGGGRLNKIISLALAGCPTHAAPQKKVLSGGVA